MPPLPSNGRLLEMGMSKSISLCFGLFALAIAAANCTGARAGPLVEPNSFSVARILLQCFYPEIFGDNRYINISTAQPVDDNNWEQFFGFEFRVVRFAPHTSWNPTFDPNTGKMRPTPENTVFLEGAVWTGRDGQILRFTVDGELAHKKENEKFIELARTHPGWSEEQAARALKAAGAQFGPAEEKKLLDSLNFQSAENYLGRIKIRLVEFEGLSPEHEGSFARLYWIVQAQGEYSDGHHRTYGFSFEPFGGKLTGLHEIPDRKYEGDPP
jgi:hypothetical protein